MCGIAGIFLIDQNLSSSLGNLLTKMLVPLSDRGPDSAGVAIYKEADENTTKISVQSEDPVHDFLKLSENIKIQTGRNVIIEPIDSHAIIKLDELDVSTVCDYLKNDTNVRIMSVGAKVEIYKEIGPPDQVLERFNVPAMGGTHAIGHTRMATESGVDIRSAHPYWAYPFSDVSVVHNGQLTNYWNNRRALEAKGMRFLSSCDSELIAVYLADKIREGMDLEEAMKGSLEHLDGVFTYLVATKDKLGMAKDTMAAKPMVLYESDDLVALASEEVAIRSVMPTEIDTYDPYEGEVKVWQA